MCGIAGLYLKNERLRPRLGELFTPILVELTDRGPDSAGIAVYRDPVAENAVKLTVHHADQGFAWDGLVRHLKEGLGVEVADHPHDTHHVLVLDGKVDADAAAALVEAYDPGLQVMSAGHVIEIYKEMGLPAEVARRFDAKGMAGTHAVGHTRMATESAVTTAGSHPFSTGLDLCLVHNGSLSNHNGLREKLKRNGVPPFRTDNDTEVAAAYLAWRMKEGRTLHEALQDGLNDLDGFYTFVAGTADGFAVMRDPIACKPAVLAETDDYVAFGSEYRALVRLPGIEHAKVWEPEPAVVYSWGGRA
ncbi:MAG: glutamine amidotransferase [Geminicoccaceae bacterium]|nr:glutamine amidotransferase [Geminicoccaceae bacterium]